jgi:ligand-binding SRPBCC domain-containing protein
MNLFFRTPLSQPVKAVAKKFDRELFDFLTPAWASVKTVRFDGCKTGDEIHLELKVAGLPQKWVSVVTETKDEPQEWSFVDEGKVLPWPLKGWRHHHKIVRTSDFRSEIIDDITYECASPVLEKLIYPMMWATFSMRPGRYKKYFRN